MIDHVIGDSDSTTDETYSIDLCNACSAKKEDGAVVGYFWRLNFEQQQSYKVILEQEYRKFCFVVNLLVTFFKLSAPERTYYYRLI